MLSQSFTKAELQLNHLKHKQLPPQIDFATKIKTPIKKNNKTLHQQSLLLNDTDITSDDDDHIYTRIPESDSSFSIDTTIQQENFSTLKKSTSKTPPENSVAMNVQTNSPSVTHFSQIIPFYDTSFFKYKNYFEGLMTIH